MSSFISSSMSFFLSLIKNFFLSISMLLVNFCSMCFFSDCEVIIILSSFLLNNLLLFVSMLLLMFSLFSSSILLLYNSFNFCVRFSNNLSSSMFITVCNLKLLFGSLSFHSEFSFNFLVSCDNLFRWFHFSNIRNMNFFNLHLLNFFLTLFWFARWMALFWHACDWLALFWLARWMTYVWRALWFWLTIFFSLEALKVKSIRG